MEVSAAPSLLYPPVYSCLRSPRVDHLQTSETRRWGGGGLQWALSPGAAAKPLLLFLPKGTCESAPSLIQHLVASILVLPRQRQALWIWLTEKGV